MIDKLISIRSSGGLSKHPILLYSSLPNSADYKIVDGEHQRSLWIVMSIDSGEVAR